MITDPKVGTARPNSKAHLLDSSVSLVFSQVILATVAALALSPIGWNKVLKVGGNFYPEPALLILVIFAMFSRSEDAELLRRAARSPLFLWSAIGLFALAAIGFFFHFQLAAVYSDFRPCVLLAYTLSIFAVEPINLKLSAGKMAFWINFYMIVFNIVGNFLFPSETDSVKVVYPILSSIYCVSFCVRYKKVVINDLFLYCSALLGCIMALLSFYRAFYLCAIISTFVAFLYAIGSIVMPGRTLANRISGTLVIISAIFMLSSGFITTRVYAYLSSSESRYIQSVGKMNDILAALGGEDSTGSEEIRGMYYTYMWNHMSEFMLPSGLGQKAVEGNWRSQWNADSRDSDILKGATFSSKDGGLIYMATQFGVIISVIVIVICSFMIFSSDREYRWGEIPGYRKDRLFRFLLFIPIIFIYLLTGAMFVQVAFSISFACCLGLFIYWRHFGLIALDE